MGTGEILIWAAATLAVIAGTTLAVIAVLRPRRIEAIPRRATGSAGRITIALDLPSADPTDARVRRLVRDAADRILATVPEAAEIEVVSPAGKRLAMIGRLARPHLIHISPFLFEPHTPAYLRARSPFESPTGAKGPPHGGGPVRAVAEAHTRPEAESPKPLADRFDLSGGIRARLGDRDDAVAVVRAILQEGGKDPRVDGDTLLVDDEVVIVLPQRIGFGSHEDLNHAYMTYRRAGANSGVVVALGYTNPIEVHRREALDPSLVHIGPDGVQRMADAAALGADPLRWARAPAPAHTHRAAG